MPLKIKYFIYEGETLDNSKLAIEGKIR